MSVFSSLNVGITGVQVQSNALNTISDNIANVNTVGYKEGRTTFADLVFDNSANTYSVNGGGAVNSAISFSGAEALDTSLNSVQGGISSTNSISDLAISGSGLFAVLPTDTSTHGELAYTRAGSFVPDAKGNYTNAAGYVLQGWALSADGTLPASLTGADVSSGAAIAALVPINIQNSAPTTVATTTVSIQANLNATQPFYTGTPAYDPTDATANMASGSVQSAFTIPVTVVDSTGVSHTLEVGVLKGPTVLADSGAGPFSYTSDSTTMTVTGTPPSGLAVGDIVSFNGSGPILDSNGNTILNAAQINTSHSVLSVNSGSYTVSVAATSPATIEATGNIAFAANPSAGDTINLNGTTWTFVTNGATGDETNIGATLGATLTQLASDLTAAATDGDVNLAAATYGISPASLSPTELTVTSTVSGLAGATYTLASTQLNGTPSGATLAGPGGIPATGSLSFTSNPSAGDTIDLNGVTWTFVTGAAGTDQTHIGATLSDTLTQLVSDLTASTNANLATSVYTSTGTALDISHNTGDTTSNNYTLGAAVATQNLSGADGTSTPATGSLSFAVNPNAGDTIDINGTMITFVTSAPAADQVQIGATPSDTVNALQTFLAGDVGDGNINVATYGATGTTLNITYNTDNLAGNSYTLSGIVPATSAATLLGGDVTTNSGGASTAGIAGGDGVVDQLTPNTWAVEIYANPATDVSATNGQVASGLVTFNADGTLASVSSSLTQAVPITWTDAGAAASDITFNWGTAGVIFGTPNATVIGKSDGLEQVADSYSVKNIDQNGVAAGTSATISISSSGVISATYSNGNTQNLYQIPLAQFSDPDQLQGFSGNVYKPSVDTGPFTFFSPGELGTSSIDTSSLESSNVDLASQLTNMIIAQNAYQANTKVLSTSDEMLQSLTSMDQGITV